MVKGNPPPSGPVLLPPLIRGESHQQGPFTVTVTDEMVAERERQNQKIQRRWEHEQKRKQMLTNGDKYFEEFNEFNVRRRFIRRVFFILMLQLMFTTAVVTTFLFVPQAKEFMLMHLPTFFWVSFVTFFFTYCGISCCEYARRDPPWNVIYLVLLTISSAILASIASVHYTTEVVIIAIGITTLVTVIIWITATCTKFDLTKHSGLVFTVCVVLFVSAIALLLILMFTQIKAAFIGIGIVGALGFSFFLFFDVQTLMGGRVYEISPDEVVYATTQIYVDVIMLYRYILILLGAGSINN